MSIQSILIVLGAAGLMLSTVLLVRKRLLSIRYGLGWLAVSAAGIVVAPMLEVVVPRVQSLGFSPTGFSLGLFIGFLGLVCLQLSITLSGLHGAVQDLAEHAALVEQRVRELESRDA